MAWGHAVSLDLATWDERPPALLEDDEHSIFSGSAVVDEDGEAGFGKRALVAAYTSAAHNGSRQVQRLAYSKDDGRTWTKYAGNPVLDEGLADFRDPNIFWHEPSAKWIMVVALSAENLATVYGSADLRQWTRLSTIGPHDGQGRIWECPLLIELPVEGEAARRWLFKVDLLHDGPGSGAIGVIGAFDGVTFAPEGAWRLLDHGCDFYAAIAWHDPRDSLWRRAWVGWMGNHGYQAALPTRDWRGAMSRPRRLSLVRDAAGALQLRQEMEPAVVGLFSQVSAIGAGRHGIPGSNFTVTDALGTAVLPSLIVGPQTGMLHYNKKYTSWSLGALYAVTNSTSIFGRVSKGGRFNADRRTLGGNFHADGSLNTQGQVTAVNFVTQQEVGIKTRGPIGGGRYSLQVTGFRAQLIDNNYDFTQINNPAPNNNPVISNGYKSYGLEATLGLHLGKFSLVGDATYSHSRITASVTSAIVGKIPHSTPSFYWVLSPSYDAGIFAIGASANGQNSTYADDTNTVRIPGQTYVNSFVKIRPIDRVELGFNVNNLFNTLGYRGSGSLVTTGATTGIFQNSAVLGRTMTASIRYKF